MADTTGPKTEFWCQECSRKYRDAASLQDHQRNKHGPKDVTCKLCQDKFRTRQQYKNHLRGTSHRSTAGNHCCVECGKPYKIWGFRRMHERDVHNILDVVFCKKCAAGFYSEKDLQDHKANHCSGRKPYANKERMDLFNEWEAAEKSRKEAENTSNMG